jgi:predicted nucleic acid-binding Zn ribbon protein
LKAFTVPSCGRGRAGETTDLAGDASKAFGFFPPFPDRTMSDDGPTHLGDVLEEVIDELGARRKIDEARVVETWASVVSDQINGVTESAWMKDSTLYVKISSAAWRQELHMNRRKWRERLNGALGQEVVEEIVFR